MKDFCGNPDSFVFDKTYHSVLRDSALVHPESALSVPLMVYFFKGYFFVSCFPAIPLNRTKLKYGTMKLKAYEKTIWMIELCANFLRPKVSLSVHPEKALRVYLRLHFLWCN